MRGVALYVISFLMFSMNQFCVAQLGSVTTTGVNITCCDECQYACWVKRTQFFWTVGKDPYGMDHPDMPHLWNFCLTDPRLCLYQCTAKCNSSHSGGNRTSNCKYLAMYPQTPPFECGACCLGETRRIDGTCRDSYTSSCVACTSCVAGVTYRSGGCSHATGTQDSICSPCTVCKATEYEISACTPTKDTVCSLTPNVGITIQGFGTPEYYIARLRNQSCCTECLAACELSRRGNREDCMMRSDLCRIPCRNDCPNEGLEGTRSTNCAKMFYSVLPANKYHCGACCLPGTYRLSTVYLCSDPYNASCKTCSSCTSGVTYASGGCTGTSDTICSNCTVCKSNQVKIRSCTATSDTVCSFCPPDSPPSVCIPDPVVVVPVTTPAPSSTVYVFVPQKKSCTSYLDCNPEEGAWSGCAYEALKYGCVGSTLYMKQFGLVRNESADNYQWSGFSWKTDSSLLGWCWRQGSDGISQFCMSVDLSPIAAVVVPPVAGPSVNYVAPPVLNISYSFYKPTPCTLAADAAGVCTVCSPACTSGFYERIKCTNFTNRVCDTCPSNFYCPFFTDAFPCTVCQTGTYQHSPCTALSDRVCRPCTVCPDNHYTLSLCTPSADTGTCLPCTNCGSGYETTTCSGITNAVCAACPVNSYCDGKKFYALQLTNVYMLATQNDDNTRYVLRLYDYQSKNLIRSWTLDHWITKPYIHFCPFGDCVMYIDSNYYVRRLYINSNLNTPQIIYPVTSFSYGPKSLAIAPNQTFLLVGMGSALYMFNLYTQKNSLIAGRENSIGDVDGPGATARFRCADYISIHPSGTWAVFTDTLGYKIKKINLTDGLFTVSTLMGNGIYGNPNGNQGPLAGYQLADTTILHFNYDGTEIYFHEQMAKKIQSLNLLTNEITNKITYDSLTLISTYFDIFFSTPLLTFMIDGDTGYRDYWTVAPGSEGGTSAVFTSNTYDPSSTVWVYKCRYPGFGWLGNPSLFSCEPCTSGKFSIGGVCKNCDSPCTSGQFPFSECTAKTNRICQRCSDFRCPSGQYQSGVCNSTTAPTCKPCTTCSPGFYKPVGCTTTADASGTCQVCSVCGTGTYMESPCNTNANTVCRNCSNCTAGVLKACNATADTTCCTATCAAGMYMSKPCYAGSDITCTSCRANPPYYNEPLKYCPGDNNGYYCDGCMPARHPACQGCAAGTYEESSCTATKNRVCKKCDTCGNGTYNIAACAWNKNTVCAACPPNHTCPGDGNKYDCGDYCYACDPGYFMSGKNGKYFCSPCAAGQFSKFVGKIHACDNCPSGVWSQAASSACTLCSPLNSDFFTYSAMHGVQMNYNFGGPLTNGGGIYSDMPGYLVYRFDIPRDYTVYFPNDMTGDVLFVGGGGGGAGGGFSALGGGGGAGGVVFYKGYVFKKNTAYRLRVGKGGNGGLAGYSTLDPTQGGNGEVSMMWNFSEYGKVVATYNFEIDNTPGIPAGSGLKNVTQAFDNVMGTAVPTDSNTFFEAQGGGGGGIGLNRASCTDGKTLGLQGASGGGGGSCIGKTLEWQLTGGDPVNTHRIDKIKGFTQGTKGGMGTSSTFNLANSILSLSGMFRSLYTARNLNSYEDTYNETGTRNSTCCKTCVDLCASTLSGVGDIQLKKEFCAKTRGYCTKNCLPEHSCEYDTAGKWSFKSDCTMMDTVDEQTIISVPTVTFAPTVGGTIFKNTLRCQSCAYPRVVTSPSVYGYTCPSGQKMTRLNCNGFDPPVCEPMSSPAAALDTIVPAGPVIFESFVYPDAIFKNLTDSQNTRLTDEEAQNTNCCKKCLDVCIGKTFATVDPIQNAYCNQNFPVTVTDNLGRPVPVDRSNRPIYGGTVYQQSQNDVIITAQEDNGYNPWVAKLPKTAENASQNYDIYLDADTYQRPKGGEFGGATTTGESGPLYFGMPTYETTPYSGSSFNSVTITAGAPGTVILRDLKQTKYQTEWKKRSFCRAGRIEFEGDLDFCRAPDGPCSNQCHDNGYCKLPFGYQTNCQILDFPKGSSVPTCGNCDGFSCGLGNKLSKIQGAGVCNGFDTPKCDYTSNSQLNGAGGGGAGSPGKSPTTATVTQSLCNLCPVGNISFYPRNRLISTGSGFSYAPPGYNKIAVCGFLTSSFSDCVGTPGPSCHEDCIDFCTLCTNDLITGEGGSGLSDVKWAGETLALKDLFGTSHFLNYGDESKMYIAGGGAGAYVRANPEVTYVQTMGQSFGGKGGGGNAGEGRDTGTVTNGCTRSGVSYTCKTGFTPGSSGVNASGSGGGAGGYSQNGGNGGSGMILIRIPLCQPCMPGTILQPDQDSNKTIIIGKFKCVPCHPGTYSPGGIYVSKCIPCPKNTGSGWKSSSCVPNANYNMISNRLTNAKIVFDYGSEWTSFTVDLSGGHKVIGGGAINTFLNSFFLWPYNGTYWVRYTYTPGTSLLKAIIFSGGISTTVDLWGVTVYDASTLVTNCTMGSCKVALPAGYDVRGYPYGHPFTYHCPIDASTSSSCCKGGEFIENGTCKECPEGTWSEKGNDTSCLACPIGKWSTGTPKSNPDNHCRDCPDNTPWGQESTYRGTLGSCPTGQVKRCAASNRYVCCKRSQYFLEGSNMTACQNCSPTFFTNDGSAKTCIDSCPNGTYYTVLDDDLPICLTCPNGKFSNVWNSSNVSTCKSCPAGSYVHPLRTWECTLCTPGQYSFFESTTCFSCPAGQYSVNVSSFCINCVPGTVTPSSGLSACTACVPGKYSFDTVFCASCFSGTYNNKTGATACLECGDGIGYSKPGATYCFNCTKVCNNTALYQYSGVGWYISLYCDMSSDNICALCTNHKDDPYFVKMLTQGEGFNDCRYSCKDGYEQDPVLISNKNLSYLARCVKCPVGKFRNSGEWRSNYTTSSSSDNSDIISQPENTCANCPAGKYQWITGYTYCFDCPKGWFLNVTGQTICQACLKGTISSAVSQTTCFTCLAGTYSSSDYTSTCISCIPGTYSTQNATTICLNCKQGEYQNLAAQTFCINCAIGYYNAFVAAPNCDPCSAGTYSLQTNSTFCYICQKGYSQAEPGQSFCDICQAGKYSSKVGANICPSCSPGTYQQFNQMTECDLCPINTLLTAWGGTSISECAGCGNGTYVSPFGDETCINCPPGTISGGVGDRCDADAGSVDLQRGLIFYWPLESFDIYRDFSRINSSTNSLSPSNNPPLTRSITCTINTVWHEPSPCYAYKTDSDLVTTGYLNQNGVDRPADTTFGQYLFKTRIYIPANFTMCLWNQLYMLNTGSDAFFNSEFQSRGYSLLQFTTSTGNSSYFTGRGTNDMSLALVYYANAQGKRHYLQYNFSDRVADKLVFEDYSPLSWFHTCFYRTTTEAGLYVRGAGGIDVFPKVFTTSIKSYQSVTGGYYDLMIGMDQPNNRVLWQGYVDNIRIYDRKLSVEEMNNLTYFRGDPKNPVTNVPCAAGTFSTGVSASVCKVCTPGKYSAGPLYSDPVVESYGRAFYDSLNSYLPGATECSLCPAGKYNTGSQEQYSWSCKSCLAGTTQTAPGSTFCTLCPMGKFTGSSAQPECTNCSSGSYVNYNGAGACRWCDDGYYNEQEGQTACFACSGICPAGTGRSKSCNSWSDRTCSACLNSHPDMYVYTAGGINVNSCPFNCRAGYIKTGVISTGPCGPCSSGKYQSIQGYQGSIVGCLLCPSGTYATYSAATFCEDCTVGSFVNSTTGYCVKCPEGKISNTTKSTFCFNCDVGTFNSLVEATVCSNCGVGTFTQLSGLSVCSLCSPGSFTAQNRSATCNLCNTGTFSSGSGLTFCSTCSRGTYASASSLTFCERCTPGKYSDTLAAPSESNCLTCVAGSYTDVTASTVCLACPQGKISSTSGLSTCFTCTPGTYANNFLTSCLTCGVGKFSTGTGMSNVSACESCLAGRYNNKEGMNSSAACLQCTAGTYSSDSAQSTCVECQRNTWSATVGAVSSLTCSMCILGKFSNKVGATAIDTCANCPAGNFLIAGNCDYCATGTYQSLNGQSFCINCTAGSYASMPGSTACVDCEKGKFSALPVAPTSATCASCSSGSYSSLPASTNCTLCSVGAYQVAVGASECFLCDSGTQQSNPGSPTCFICQAGFYSTGSGSTACINCLVGTFQASPQKSSCSNCSAGTYQNVSNASSCLVCLRGSFSNPNGATTCQLCTAGSIQPSSNKTSCTQCAKGLYQPAAGATVCLVCLPGTFSNVTSSTTCYNCSIGTFVYFSQESVCISCHIGLYRSATGGSECQQCLKGSFSNVTGSTVCQTCSLGTFQPNNQMSSCNLCSTGLYRSATGGTDCQTCSAGSYSAVSGSTECKLCSVGTFQASSQMSFCTLCSAGLYRSATAGTDCQTCSAGSFSNVSGSTACHICSPGSNQSAPQMSSCSPCPAGSYQPASEAALCTLCGTGKYQTGTGMSLESKCETCPSGKYQTGLGAQQTTSCRNCLPGTFVAFNRPNQCTNCPANSNSVTAATSCQCNTGYAGLLTRSDDVCSVCTVCGANAFTYGVCNPVTRADNVTCACNAGYYGNGKTCTPCLPCDVNAQRTECPLNSSTDVSKCECRGGYFGNGRTCAVCGGCSSDGVNLLNCSTGSLQDVSLCVCKAGFYGDGRVCTACEPCHIQADRTECPLNSSQDVSSCTCKEHFYGDGRNCYACSFCDENAFYSLTCTAGSSTDVSNCLCNAGYYGNGKICWPCDVCDPNAARSGCAIGSTSDNSQCTCNAGYYGGVRTCSRCAPCALNASRNDCTGGAVDNSECKCNDGFWGNGRFCNLCTPCDPNAVQTRWCYGNLTDVSTCSCNAGYYGSGKTCFPCSGCGPNSMPLVTCQAGTTVDTSACVCNSGFFSPSGFDCAQCPQGTWGLGGTNCTPCGKGLYSDLTGQNVSDVCTPCPNNTYAPNASSGNLSTACLPCPASSTTQGNGSTSRTQCKCSADLVSNVTEWGGFCYLCSPNFYASDDRKSCVACPLNTESRAGSLYIWQCTAVGGYFAKYTKTVKVQLEVPEEDGDPAALEAYVRAAIQAGDDVQVQVEL